MSSTASPTVILAVSVLAIIGTAVAYLVRKPPLPKNAPPLTSISWPVIGSLQFFTERWDFFRTSMNHSSTGNFSFYAGQYPIIGLAGDGGRKVFFESKGLGFSEGYSKLLAGGEAPKPLISDPQARDAADFSNNYFNKRLINMVKAPQLRKGLPRLLQDARDSLDTMSPDGITMPFDSIYRLVYKFTMRTVACNDIADDPALLKKTLALFEAIEGAASPLMIMYPWLPLPGKIKRTYAGAQLYMVIRGIMDARKTSGKRDEDDALQYLMDEGDNATDIITFVLGALYAGLLNSGINAAWIITYLAHKPYWLAEVRKEVEGVAARYAPDRSLPLKDQLMTVPFEAWETDFPLIDLCLRDSIRLQALGTGFRRNITGADIPIPSTNQVIPADAFVAYAFSATHLDPAIYPNPSEWDPSRYMPEKAEDKKQPNAFLGWGVSRHPCLGMKFAKLENNVIIAMFLAYFDNIHLVDKYGKPTERIPEVNNNGHTAHKPKENVWVKFKPNAH